MMARLSKGPVGPRPPDDLEEIESFVVRTGDPDHFAERLAPVAPGLRLESTVDRGFGARARAWKLPGLGPALIELDHGRALYGEEREFFGVTVPLAQEIEIKGGRRLEEYLPGEAHVSPAHEPFDCRTPRGSRVLALHLDDGLVLSHKRALEEGRRARTSLTFRLCSSDAKCGSVFRYLSWLSDELQREGSALAVPHVAIEAVDLLVAMLVAACWPPDAARGEGGRDALRRAEEFLAARLEAPVSLPEVAAAAGVSLRTLTRAFHEKHGVGPIGFLRRRRLEAARRDLRAVVPGSESVTKVALRYGFAHLGRFAGAYCKAFGEYPSETLRR
jgi:AraC-like DNA-binding protein